MIQWQTSFRFDQERSRNVVCEDFRNKNDPFLIILNGEEIR